MNELPRDAHQTPDPEIPPPEKQPPQPDDVPPPEYSAGPPGGRSTRIGGELAGGWPSRICRIVGRGVPGG